LSRLFIKLFN